MEIVCAKCKKKFTVSAEDVAYYMDHDMRIPNICEDCKNRDIGASIKIVGQDGEKDKHQFAVKDSGKKSAVSFGSDDYKGDLDNGYVPHKSLNVKAVEIACGILAVIVAVAVIIVLNQGSKVKTLTFTNEVALSAAFNENGFEVGAETADEYLSKANAVINNSDALKKTRTDDEATVYFLEDTLEYVVVSKDGFIETYQLESYSYFEEQ